MVTFCALILTASIAAVAIAEDCSVLSHAVCAISTTTFPFCSSSGGGCLHASLTESRCAGGNGNVDYVCQRQVNLSMSLHPPSVCATQIARVCCALFHPPCDAYSYKPMCYDTCIRGYTANGCYYLGDAQSNCIVGGGLTLNSTPPDCVDYPTFNDSFCESAHSSEQTTVSSMSFSYLVLSSSDSALNSETSASESESESASSSAKKRSGSTPESLSQASTDDAVFWILVVGAAIYAFGV